MYTIRLENPMQRILVSRVLERALAAAGYTACFVGLVKYRLPRGYELKTHSGAIVKRTNLAIFSKAQQHSRRSQNGFLYLADVRRCERGPWRGSFPPEVAHYFPSPKRKTGVQLDWPEWLKFNAVVNGVLDRVVGRTGDVWSKPPLVGKLIIRKEGHAVVDYRATVTESRDRLTLLSVFA